MNRSILHLKKKVAPTATVVAVSVTTPANKGLPLRDNPVVPQPANTSTPEPPLW